MNHLKQIAARLPEYGLDAMLLNSEPGEYYAVGFHGEGNVVVTAQGCFYFTDSRYIEAANHLITGAEIAMTGRSRNYRAMVQEVVDRCRIRKLGFEEGYLSVADYNLWKEGLTAELVPAQKLVDALRAAKDDGEIALMTKAQEITDRAFSEILKFIQPGMTEQEIAAKLQYDMLRFGAEKMSFHRGFRPQRQPAPRHPQRQAGAAGRVHHYGFRLQVRRILLRHDPHRGSGSCDGGNGYRLPYGPSGPTGGHRRDKGRRAR